MKLIGLVSCYREGHLLDSTLRSAVAACDEVGVFEGPVGKDYTVLGEQKYHGPGYQYVHFLPARRYKDDADKRNVSLRWAVSKQADWVLWLDGDEVLIWPEYLRDWVARAEHTTGVGGFPMRVVELDGSVALANNRIVKPDVVREYLVGASTVELTTGMVIQLPSEKVCGAGGIPWGNMPATAAPGSAEMELFLARHRPPVGGEPHILHRSMLRDPDRNVQRQHLAEAERFEELAND